MGNVVKMNQQEEGTKERCHLVSGYAEDPQAQYLFTGKDKRGKLGYFIRINVLGLRDRVFGPFPTRSLAVAQFDHCLLRLLESFCDIDSVHHRGTYYGMQHVALPDDLRPVAMAKAQGKKSRS